MSLSFNIDIHCHPSSKPYMSGVEHKQHSPFETYTHKIEDKLFNALRKFIARFSEVELATQSNFDRLFEGGFKVIVASITPMERGFLVANRSNEKISADIAQIQTKPPFEGTIRPKVINAITGFGIADVENIRSSVTFKDYFQNGYLAEYNYLVQNDGKPSLLHSYTLKFVKNFTEIQEGIAANEKVIYVILSIEGGHALSSKPPMLIDIGAGQGNAHANDPVNFSSLKEYDDNITALKKLPFVPFFVTPMHHFWNGLGGHARSLNKLVGSLVNQSEGINVGLNELGKEVIKLLLDNKKGPRILIDIKHMSARSRVDFYKLLSKDFSHEHIPIICSHGGIASKTASLEEFIANEQKEDENDEAQEANSGNYLYECSINLCREDIIKISESDGLIGIQLDEKRISGKGFIKIKEKGNLTDEQLTEEYAKVLAANIFEAIRAVDNVKAWDMIAIGSDFDGLINHLDNCPTAAEVSKNIKLPLLRFLNAPTDISHAFVEFNMTKETITELMFDLTPEIIIEKIFSGNVMQFLKKNFV